VPTTGTDFLSGVNRAFNNAFKNVAGTLGNFLGLAAPKSGTFTLPTTPFSNTFSPSFSTLGNGFNNGFGSGFIGFGQQSTGNLNNFIANSFGNGFNAITTTENEQLGFTPSGASFNGFGTTGEISGSGTGISLGG
jgi:hypothetical protein